MITSARRYTPIAAALAAFSGALMLLATGAAQAEGVGEAQRGFRLALKVCEECHIVAAGRKLPKPPVKGAPSFFELAKNPEVTPFYLRAFFRTPHQRMPDFILKQDEQDDLIAYIMSLRPKIK